MVELLEKWGNLPEGASELVNNNELKDATRSQLTKFAEELGDEVVKEHVLKETNLDLDRLRWPTTVTVRSFSNPDLKFNAVIDHMGRFFFRFQDVEQEYFIPGYFLIRDEEPGVQETILESTVLYVGDHPVCIQVTTDGK